MNKNKIVSAVLLCMSFLVSNAQTAQEQRVQASYMLSFGRPASGGEVTHWISQGNLSIADLISRHRNYLSQDANTHSATITRAYIDAFGRNPTPGEIDYWKKGNDTYTALMQNNLQFLQGNTAEYTNVINRSYKFVFNRKASAGEIDYWMKQPKTTYMILVALHQDYQRRSQTVNASNLNVNNASALAITPLQKSIANEAASAVGFSINGSSLVAAGGGNLVAAGGGNLVAAGGGNLVAAGGGN